MKPDILHALLIGSILSISIATCTMDQEQAIPSAQKGWLLKNGTRADGWTVFTTHLNVIAALHGNNRKGGLAVIELVQNCRDEKSPISKKSGEHLELYGLVDKDHKPYPELKNIIVSMARGNGENMIITGPTK